EGVSATDQARLMLEAVVVDRRWRVHHLVERRSVLVGVLDLQQFVLGKTEMVGVMGKGVELLGQTMLSHRHEDFRRGIHQQLEGGQPLLTVDHGEGANRSDVAELLLEDDGTQEVSGVGGSWAHSQLSQSADVSPQWRQLILLCP